MEIESGYPSEGEARTAGFERPMIETSPQHLELLNESRISYKEPILKAPRVSQDKRFRIFNSLGF